MMKGWCKFLVSAWLLTGVALPSKAAVVLLYHHVGDATPKSTSISPAAFEAQMEYLDKNNFQVVKLSRLVEHLRRGETLPDKTVAITFDDSYKSVYDSAYPRLKKRGWPFTFFINTDAVGASRSSVSWDQLREMAKHGATIANHSSTHAHLPRKMPGESLDEFRQRIHADIDNAQQKIAQEIGTAPMMLAYPFGEYDVEVQRIAKRLGYVAFGQQSGPLYEKGDLQAVPRFPFGGSFVALDDFIMKVNTRPMPVQRVSFYADRHKQLESATVHAGEKPLLLLELADGHLPAKINCFATGQGAMDVEVIGKKVWVQPMQGLKPGRTRYNCTGPAGEKGRFYWYTQQWLVADKSGAWVHQD